MKRIYSHFWRKKVEIQLSAPPSCFTSICLEQEIWLPWKRDVTALVLYYLSNFCSNILDDSLLLNLFLVFTVCLITESDLWFSLPLIWICSELFILTTLTEPGTAFKGASLQYSSQLFFWLSNRHNNLFSGLQFSLDGLHLCSQKQLLSPKC